MSPRALHICASCFHTLTSYVREEETIDVLTFVVCVSPCIQDLGEAFARSRVGMELDVLIDGYSEEDGTYLGRTQWDAPDVDPCVFVTPVEGSPALEVGTMRRCVVDGASVSDLFARPV